MQDERAEQAGCEQFLLDYPERLRELMKDPIKNKKKIENLKESYRYASIPW